MPIEYIKALHIIFVVTWFSGLFYIVRLFIYHTEAESKTEIEKGILQTQFKIMERRLWYGITWPSMIFVLISGFWLLYSYNYWLMPWMHIKLASVFGLVLYHLQCGRIYNKLQQDKISISTFKLRLWNEVATLFLVTTVFVVVLKNSFNWIWGVAGLVVFAGLLMIAIKMYKKQREKE